MQNRHTININVDEVGDIDKLLALLRAWRPPVAVLMNGLMNDKYQRIRAVLREWNAIVIYRHYEESEGHLWRVRSADAHIRLLEGLARQDADVWWHVSNEPLPDAGERGEMMKWHADVIDKAIAKGLRLCVGNLAVAAMGSKSDIDGGRWDALLAALGKHADRKVNGYSQILMGVHTYAHAVLPMHLAGRDPRDLLDPAKVAPDKWPTPAEVAVTPEDNWLIFREQWLVERIFKLTGKRVQVAITECWWDRMPNIVQQFSQTVSALDALAGREVRGLPTVMTLFEKLFPQWPAERAVCEQMLWAEKLYPADYICFALFTWSQNVQWQRDYDLGQQRVYNALMQWPAYLAVKPPPPTTPTDDPTLPTVGWYDATVAAHPEPAYVYATRSGSAPILATIRTDSMQHTVPVKVVADFKSRWWAIEYAGKRGWVYTDYADINPKEPPVAFTGIDSRWLLVKAYRDATRSGNVRPTPNGGSVATLAVGGIEVFTIPFEAMTPLEQAYVTRADGRWSAVKFKTSGSIGFIRTDFVNWQPVAVEVVTISKAEYAELTAAKTAHAELSARWLAHVTRLAQLTRRLTTARTQADEALNQLQAPLVEFTNIVEELTDLAKEN